MAPQVLSKSQADFFLRGLTSDPPQRSDGRSLLAFRPLDVDTGIAPQANGSAQINLGGTEIYCGIKAEVSNFGEDDDDDDEGGGDFQTQDEQEQAGESKSMGRIKCSVDYSQSLVHSFDNKVLETLSVSLSSMVNSVFSSRSSPIPLRQLVIIDNAKHWTVYIDLLVNSLAGGNLFDAAFASIFSALYSTRIPTTKGVAFEAPVTLESSGNVAEGAFSNAQGDLDQMGIKGLLKKKPKNASARAPKSKGPATASSSKVVDFELENNGQEGNLLSGRQDLPLCITVNILPESYVLDANVDEEACLSARVQVLASQSANVLAVRMDGTQEIPYKRINEAVQIGSVQASRLAQALIRQFSLQSSPTEEDDDDDGRRAEIPPDAMDLED